MAADSRSADTKPRRPFLERWRPASKPGPGSPNPARRMPPSAPSPAQNRFRSRNFWITLAILLAVNIFFTNVLFAPTQAKSVVIPYDVFVQQVTGDNVTSVTTTSDAIIGTAKSPVSAAPGQDSATAFSTQRPSFATDDLVALLLKHKVTTNAKNPNPATPLWETLLLSFGPVLLLVLLFVYVSRRMASMRAGGAGGILGRFGQSGARLYNAEHPPTTFADVAGIDEVKAELLEVVDFLRQPAKYERLGGTVPKGVLLIGAPGTGKTLLARAVAGEAGVPFFSISASEFIEAIVGVGASRVRDLFSKARTAAPAIIFIDEMDAVGRSRSAALRVGSNDEQEQTLNQILTEMDGFDAHEGVIVLAATNRADVLDPALLRPGRFDRRIQVHPPDRSGRAAILAIHTRNIPIDTTVDLNEIAAQTAGMVGADLRNLANEAALSAARRGASLVTLADFTIAIEKVELGSERKLMLTSLDRERIAYHESGHALLGLLLPGADPVSRVSIIPRGQSLGATTQTPVDDRFNYGEDYLRGRITGALGGRAAEQLVYGVVTTGAESDLRLVTGIAREMVVRWGMSAKVGALNYADDGGGSAFGTQRPYSDATAHLIDAEVKRISDECLVQAMDLLEANRSRLDALAHALLEHDTLYADEILRVANVSRPAVAASHAVNLAEVLDR
ncbi:MAG: ATP-dependent zinc metalloprotease FtsH [Candidatus Dormibacteraeota bacterium]|uniref:ATP-dependent zinc metalloprotease FtsH n=1 Tax=Candidatus Amunia macphersoniae TaxID=3127014 RepID=A0A934KQ31_9BACT|nr:ATP-dependent zinc metalloprotease FtsH [Candidatus Dormibacteraeota bacterium]